MIPSVAKQGGEDRTGDASTDHQNIVWLLGHDHLPSIVAMSSTTDEADNVRARLALLPHIILN
jgi:hypothetical protein